ncbi:PspC domain-containing protein [Paenibacillus ginsengihumi]|uniref:PspC domain-containing protein n=1 Tax=Paenibacillus ginsengihumi TaxID=431596 RepID=UPI00036511FF|nr:PspC domain-containing protein [Paenibacillus ginsengihumi]
MTKLYRSVYDRKITGLCGGIARRLNMDATVVRLLAVLSIFVTSGVAIPIYFIAALVVPSEPWSGSPYGPGPGYGGYDGYGHWDPHCSGGGHGYGSWKEWKRAEKHYRKAQKYGWTPPGEQAYRQEPYGPAAPGASFAAEESSPLDDMMADIEKKAMKKEIEQLRARVAQYEKQNRDKASGNE